MKRHRQDMKPLTEINVTNLLDTAFVLLMAFMLVAPSIKYGIDLSLPTVGGASMDTTQKSITIAILKPRMANDVDRIQVEDKYIMSSGELTDLLKRKKAEFPKLAIVLEADKEVKYESFAKTLGAIKDAGIDDIGLSTEPPTPETKKAPDYPRSSFQQFN